jgi:cobalt-zinc-cadmium efflux system membrane fusion protein
VPPAVRPGMYATLLIPEPGGAERATLPGEAVQRVGGEEFVFVQEQPGRYRAVLVRSEDLGDGQLAVDGVQAGAMVVTRGAYTLRSLFEGIEAE